MGLPVGPGFSGDFFAGVPKALISCYTATFSKSLCYASFQVILRNLGLSILREVEKKLKFREVLKDQ